MSNIVIWDGFGQTVISILKALLPLLVLFLIFQFFVLKLPRSYVFNLLQGTLLALVGLALFLQGVRIGFLPAGQAIGQAFGTINLKWLLVPFGFVIGFLATLSEPAVRVLGDEVEEASGGFLNKRMVLYTICFGVALFSAVGMAKILLGFSLLYIVIPGYLLAIVLLWFSEKDIVSVAFDAGGVATGPMTNTFLMSVAVAVTYSIEGRDPMIHGFGMIALIALAPTLMVLLLGLLLRLKAHIRG